MDFHGSRLVHVECPLSDVEVMCSHIGQTATGVFPIATPGGEVIVDAPGAQRRIVRPQRCLAEPHIPVQTGFHLFFGQITPIAWPAYSNGNRGYLSQATASNHFTSTTKGPKTLYRRWRRLEPPLWFERLRQEL